MNKTTQEIPDNKSQKPSKPSSTSELGDLLKLLKPLVDFHKSSEKSSDNDLRIYWDVRVLRGVDAPFMHTSGSSSLPGILGEKMRPNATSMIQKEVSDKIASPLVGELQKMIEDGTFERMEDLAKSRIVDSEGDLDDSLDPMQIAQSYDDEQV